MPKHRGRDNKAGSAQHCAFLCAMIRNYTTKVRAGELVDAEPLAQLAAIQRELDEQTALIVLQLHERGLSWQEIGDGLGMDRAAAYNKYVRRARPDRLLSSDNTTRA
jgi:hypothetical protein